MARDDLDDEERELLEQHRAQKKAERAKADSDKRAWLRNETGEEADVPYDKARSWLQQKFGIDLDDEPVQDEPDSEDNKPKLKAVARQEQTGNKPAFRVGRRVG